MKNPLVSVAVITYNQEKYIGQCLNSIMEQETDFDFEVIVCDDVSKDSTYAKAIELSRDVNFVKVHLNEKNLGPAGNLAQVISQCKGKYIAFCEGDDFWYDSSKLEKQVRVLENDATVSMVFANYGKVDHNGRELNTGVLKNNSPFFTIDDYIDGWGPHLNSILLRKEVFPDTFPPSFFKIYNPDVFIISWALARNKAAYLPETLSMYRTHDGGIFSPMDRIEKKILRYSTRLEFFKSMGNSYSDYYKKTIEKLEETLAKAKHDGKTEIVDKYMGKLPKIRRIAFAAKQGYYQLRTLGKEGD